MNYFMKTMLFGACVIFLFFTARTVSAADGQKNESAIREVLAGKQKVAHAAWWGYSAEDATAALQAAINSGAKKVIIEKMAGPWIVNQMQLANNQELFFEPGVVVQAKKGEFHRKSAALFNAWEKTNVKLIGPDATFRMHRDDYDSPDYEKAEWRHILNLHGCENVTIQGLTLTESGGDGIYLGAGNNHKPCQNITIRDVVCDRNYRQGISVISAENLLIENCVLNNTAGIAPGAGIDFEPNLAKERLVNCVMRNCQIESNESAGILLYLRPLDGTSEPVSIRIENCVTRGTNSFSAYIVTSCGPTGPVQGSIDFVNCHFEDQEKAAINVQSKPQRGLRLRFIDCILADSAKKPVQSAPIQFGTQRGDLEATGGVEFVNLTVREPVERPLMAYNDTVGMKLGEMITGTITVQRDGHETTHQLTPEVIQQWIPLDPTLEIPIVPLKAKDLHLEPTGAKPTSAQKKLPPHRIREKTLYLVHATNAEEVRLRLKYQRVAQYPDKPMTVRILSPTDKELKSINVELEKEAEVSFKADGTGTFQIQCEPGPNTVQLIESSHPTWLACDQDHLHFFGNTSDFYFFVPGKTSEFGLRFQVTGAEERLSATIYDATGKVQWQKADIKPFESFHMQRQPIDQDEVWRVQVDPPSVGILENYYLILRGIPAVLGFNPDESVSLRQSRRYEEGP